MVDLLLGDRPEPAAGTRAPAASSGASLAALGLPLLTLLLTQTASSLSLEGQVLLYLLAVVIIALVGGIIVALISAVAAALLINYHFVEPLHTLSVAHADQAVALVVFVLVAAIVSGTVEIAARRAQAAEQASEQAETLSALAGTDLDEQGSISQGLGRAREAFNMESVTLKVREPAAATGSTSAGAAGRHRAPRLPCSDVSISPHLRMIGRGPALFAEDQRVLHAFAAAAQTAYEGQQLTSRPARPGASRRWTASAPPSWRRWATICARRSPASRRP